MTSHNCQKSQAGLTQITYSENAILPELYQKTLTPAFKVLTNSIQNINSLVHSIMEHSVNNMMLRLCHLFSLFPF